MLHKEIPFLRLCIPFCAGIITARYNIPWSFLIIVSASLVSILIFLSVFRHRYSDDHFFGLIVFVLLFMSGALLFQHERESLTELNPEITLVRCTLSDYPEEKAATFMLRARMKSIFNSTGAKNAHGSLIIYARKDSSLNSLLPGDELLVRCIPSPIVNRGNPNEFDYKSYMENQSVKYWSVIESRDILKRFEPERRRIRDLALIIRNRIIGVFIKSGVPMKSIPLVSAITLGEKSMLDQEQKQVFIRAGIMHIMAVSGLHTVILCMFVFNMLFFLKGRLTPVKSGLTILFIWAFAFITGLTPSVLRATIMFSAIQAGNLMHRKVNGINSVLASAFILMIADPHVLLDAGFLLSYSAVIYIMTFYKRLYNMIEPGNRVFDFIWQSAAVTIVAQLGTLPLTIMMFNRFPLYFLLTNIVIVPISSLLIIVASILPALYPLKFLHPLPGLVLGHLSSLTEFLTAKAASLPYADIENIGIDVPQCIALSILIFTALNSFLKKEKRLIIPMAALALFAIVTLIKDIPAKRSSELIVYNIPGSIYTGIRSGKTLDIYTSDSIVRPEILRHCAVMGLKMKLHRTGQITSLRAGNKEILICMNSIPSGRDEGIIITNGNIPRRLTFKKPPETIIITTTYNPKNLKLPSSIKVHSILKSGSYIAAL